MKSKTFQPHEVRKIKFLNLTLSALFLITLLITFFIVGCERSTENDNKEQNYFSGDNIPVAVWKYSSAPEIIANNLDSPISHKAKCTWYNTLTYGSSTAEVPVLGLFFNPDEPAEYNRADDFTSLSNKWGGMMTHILSDTNYFYQGKYYLQLWMKILETPGNAVLNIDLGIISEEVIPDGKLNYEDKNMNNLRDSGEDTGIDGLQDYQEPGYQIGTNVDPNHDNFILSNVFEIARMNGTEGNFNFYETNGGLDTEDLNTNYALDIKNNYYSYRLPLNVDKLSATGLLQKVSNGWYKIRIPLNAYDSKTGDNDLIYSEILRFWIDKAKSIVHLRFAEIVFTK